jgi:hypothetical protein
MRANAPRTTTARRRNKATAIVSTLYVAMLEVHGNRTFGICWDLRPKIKPVLVHRLWTTLCLRTPTTYEPTTSQADTSPLGGRHMIPPPLKIIGKAAFKR